jgi:hypothetical protein
MLVTCWDLNDLFVNCNILAELDNLKILHKIEDSRQEDLNELELRVYFLRPMNVHKRIQNTM